MKNRISHKEVKNFAKRISLDIIKENINYDLSPEKNFEDFCECFDNYTQFSPYEFFCYELNNSQESEKLWSLFYDTLYKTSRKFIDESLKI